MTETEAAFIRQALSTQVNRGAVLDIGGGSGRFALPLWQDGYRVIVTEARLLPLHLLRRKAPDVPCILVDERVPYLPFADASVACILCMEVFAVSHQAWFWPECHRILRPGGIAISTAHNTRSYKGALKRLFFRRGGGPRDYALSSAQTRSRIRSAGLEIVCERGFSWLPVRRAANGPFVTAAAMVEERLGLGRLIAISPWILTLAQKRSCREICTEQPLTRGTSRSGSASVAVPHAGTRSVS